MLASGSLLSWLLFEGIQGAVISPLDRTILFVDFDCFQERGNIHQDVCFEVHQFFIVFHLMIVMRSDECRQTRVNQGENIHHHEIFKHWSHFLVLGELEVVSVFDYVSSFCQVVRDESSVLIVE